jgi:membrane-associated phospholipid phosphatase
VPTRAERLTRLAILSAAAFAALAFLAALDNGLLLRLDLPVQRAVEGHRVGWVTSAMKIVTWLGASPVGWALVGVVALWVFLKGRPRVAFVLAIAFGLSVAVKFPLKALIDRSRPSLAPLVHASGAAFPSGHALTAFVVFGLLPLVLLPTGPSRIVAWLGSALIVLAVGFSRIYLGEHWLTDVIGSYLLGTVFVLAVATIPPERPPTGTPP